MNHLSGPYCNLEVLNHPDLLRGGDFPQRLAQIKERADAVVIDEAHHFRNPGAQGAPALIADDQTAKGQIRGKVRLTPSRYRKLYDLIESTAGRKEVYLLTATPINNKLADFRHMVELFSRQNDNYFNRIGIHSLRGHFVKMEKDLKESIANQGQSDPVIETDMAEAQQLLSADSLFQALVVQRSRAYVKQSQPQQGATVTSFPEREAPRVADYSVKKTYRRLLTMIDEAFETPAEVEVRCSEEAGPTRWYLYDLRAEKIEEEPARIIDLIRCDPETPRHCTMVRETLSEIRGKIEKHIKNTYLKQVQAPIGVKPTLKAWMELS
jgi:hypothetical protein